MSYLLVNHNLSEDEDNHNKINSSFNPNFYNPFEIKHRRRTSKGQFKILEKAFINNPKPNAKIRQGLAESLSMTPRGVQVWFQNRRAKAKQQQQQQLQQQEVGHLKVSTTTSSPIILSSLGMVHSRSQSSLSSSTTYSTGNDNIHVIQSTNKLLPMEVIQQSSPLLLTPPQQEQEEWWNNIITNSSHHQTYNPAAVITSATTVTTDPFTTTTNNNTEHLDAWAYIDSLDINQPFIGNNKINVEDWISSTTKEDHRRHSYPIMNNNNWVTTTTGGGQEVITIII
jgi:hypothetical protein